MNGAPSPEPTKLERLVIEWEVRAWWDTAATPIIVCDSRQLAAAAEADLRAMHGDRVGFGTEICEIARRGAHVTRRTLIDSPRTQRRAGAERAREVLAALRPQGPSKENGA